MLGAHRWLVLPALLGLVAVGRAQAPAVAVKVVTYKELGATVDQRRGDIVVVDFWALTCVECIKEFPQLVEMSKKYRKQGVTAISVNVDDPHARDTLQKVRKFLTVQGADFTHVILDEKPEVWQKNLNITGLPSVFVFNRQGQVYKKYDDGVKYSDVDRDVQELLKMR
jgi:thiol-disulfide isomerase/thioredoxin